MSPSGENNLLCGRLQTRFHNWLRFALRQLGFVSLPFNKEISSLSLSFIFSSLKFHVLVFVRMIYPKTIFIQASFLDGLTTSGEQGRSKLSTPPQVSKMRVYPITSL